MRKIRLTRVSVLRAISFYFRPQGRWAGCKGRATASCINSPDPHWQIVNDVLWLCVGQQLCLSCACAMPDESWQRAQSQYWLDYSTTSARCERRRQLHNCVQCRHLSALVCWLLSVTAWRARLLVFVWRKQTEWHVESWKLKVNVLKMRKSNRVHTYDEWCLVRRKL